MFAVRTSSGVHSFNRCSMISSVQKADPEDRISLVRNPQHFFQRPQVRHQADRQESARLRVFRSAPPHQQANSGTVHGQP